MSDLLIKGQLVDVWQKRIYGAELLIQNGKIANIKECPNAGNNYILPGFIDAHVHIESAMLLPAAFAAAAVVHGTVATVSDPHEIANVMGLSGIQYMIDNSKKVPFKIFFGAPSCVPATHFETAGASINAVDTEKLMQMDDIWYLSEMMNYPGVLSKDNEVLAKIAAAHKFNKPVDGHAPGLNGTDAMAYAAAGISTDHECFTLDEALHKIHCGMKILIREGSAAKNFNALCSLIHSHPNSVMLCSDDKHPDDLLKGHINQLVLRALENGYNLFNVLQAACVNPVLHYNLPVGLLRLGEPADFIIVNSLTDFQVLHTYINGVPVAAHGTALFNPPQEQIINQFNWILNSPDCFKVPCSKPSASIRVIEAIPGQLITNQLLLPAKIINGLIVSDTQNDILKIAVINRYTPNQPIAIGFIKNFTLNQGALASTVAHDCHNLIVIGCDDESMYQVAQALINAKGGIAALDAQGAIHTLPLPVAGLMSTHDAATVAEKYTQINTACKSLGCTLPAPFMTLSFMALLVIPSLKLSDMGLFNGNQFQFCNLIAE